MLHLQQVTQIKIIPILFNFVLDSSAQGLLAYLHILHKQHTSDLDNKEKAMRRDMPFGFSTMMILELCKNKYGITEL